MGECNCNGHRNMGQRQLSNLNSDTEILFNNCGKQYFISHSLTYACDCEPPIPYQHT